MQFEDIYETYSPRVFRLCMGYLNDADLAKDCVQEIFIKIWENLHKLNNTSALNTWTFRIATNHCLRQIEKQNKLPKSPLTEELEAPTTSNQENETKFLYQCISELREIDRILISLELEDVRQAEIANILGISETNVRVRIHRVKEKLALKFKGYER